MKKDYVIYLIGDYRYITYNTEQLLFALDNLSYFKEQYKNEFNYFSGMRSNWFGLLLLPLVANNNYSALCEFRELIKDKKFNRVYVHNFEMYRYKPVFKYHYNDVYTEESRDLHFTCYENDIEYVKTVIYRIMRLFGFSCVIEEADKEKREKIFM